MRDSVGGLRVAVPRRPRGTGDGFPADWFMWTVKFQGFVEGRAIGQVGRRDGRLSRGRVRPVRNV